MAVSPTKQVFITDAMEEFKLFADEKEVAENDSVTKFHNSLQELRDLSSHLHNAATYCEDTFLNPKSNKGKVVENTKEYICRAVVTVVDHLGSVSAAIECRLSESNTLAEAELRIDCLKQRLFTWQHYSYKLPLVSHRLNAHFPRHFSRYINPPNGVAQSTNENSRGSGVKEKIEFETEEEMPLFLYTYNCKPCLVKEESKSGALEGVEKRKRNPSIGDANGLEVLPVRSGQLSTPKAQTKDFQFQQESPKLKSPMLSRRLLLQRKDFLSLVRRGKRALLT